MDQEVTNSSKAIIQYNQTEAIHRGNGRVGKNSTDHTCKLTL
jgi:hypothetical protein